MEIKPYLKSIMIRKAEGELSRGHPFNIPAVKYLDTLEFHPDVTFLVGENGSGKSTLLEAIAGALDFGAQGGTGNFRMADLGGDSKLCDYIRPKRSFQKPRDRYFLRAESFYNVSTYMDELAEEEEQAGRMSKAEVLSRYGGKSLHHRSHGESFMSALVEGFGGKGLYILDEPEAALSPSTQLTALSRINDLVNDDSQFIIATHSPIFMSYPQARIYLLDERGCQEISYEETMHFKVTRDFLNNYPTRLKQLVTNTRSLDLPDADE
jgi:predicted ATPase